MIDFDFYQPTKIYFGLKKERLVGDICASYNFKRVLIVVGQGSIKRCGLLDVVTEKLNEKGIKYELIEGVRPNPTIDLCHEGIKKALMFLPDLILAIGGGSVIDTAKNIAVGYYYSGDSFDFNLHKAVPTKALPVGVILTISASGSESSNSCVIQDDKTGIKLGFNNDIVRPIFAIENPQLTYSVSKQQTAYGVVDIIMHTLERYMQPSCDNEPADRYAEALLKTVIKASKTVMKNPMDYEARAVLMLQSTFSHNDLTNIGKQKLLPVHALEHALSGLYPSVTHAAGLALLFPRWARYYIKMDTDKFACLATKVFEIKGKTKLDTAKKGIDAMEKLFIELGMPQTFKDLGIDNPDIEQMTNILTNNGVKSVPHHKQPIDKLVAKEIYEACK